MSRNWTLLAGSAVLCASLSNIAAAQHHGQTECYEDRVHVQKFWYDYYRNKAWPQPFRAMDTSSVVSYFEVQRNNGWRLHNTLGNAMFDVDTGALNDAGQAHVEWIVKRAPRERQVVFVLEGKDKQETANRIEAAQVAISRLIPTGSLPPIYLTDEDAPGSSGAYQTAINRALNTSVPQPRLPVSPASVGGYTGTP